MGLKKDLNLIDIWRKIHPNDIEYTFIDPSCNSRNSRIDIWLCSKLMRHAFKSCTINQAPAPDHKAVCLVLSMNTNARGVGYWKMNTEIIGEKEYDNEIKKIFTEAMNEYSESISKSKLWEFIKVKIKQFSIAYCINRARVKKDYVKDLEIKLDNLDKELSKQKDLLKEKQRKILKNELDNSYKSKAKGHQVRSRAKWVEEGERSSKYFLNLEKGRQNANSINCLKDPNGKKCEENNELLNIATTFYSDLYKSQTCGDVKVDEYMDAVRPEAILSVIDRNLCEGKITQEECIDALKIMKKNKSPGLDGICIEFYQTYWPIVGQLLRDVFNESYENETLTDSQRKSVISLIFKNGDNEDIANYRPISLTNVDYRILAFVLANRLQKVIGSIVNNDQTAYIKGRYMGYNIRLVSDVVEYYDMSEKSGILMTLDFKKAFDSLEWNFLLKTLDFFNFGPSFKKWIKTIYDRPEACIKNNGHISNSFSIYRGIRQGCPVSALLFVLAVEILGLKIRQSPTIKGFHFGYPNKPIKLMQYADDGILFLNYKDKMCSALGILNEFGSVAGTMLNLSKCEGLWLGQDKNKQNNCKIFGIRWPEQIRFLGIYIGHSKDKNNLKNWDDKIAQIVSLLNSWSKRDLTLFGKVQIIKSFAVSKLVMSATLLHTPDKVVKTINSVLFNFLWGSKDKVKRIKVIKQVKEGGLNMIDIKSLFDSFKATWVPKIMNANPEIHGWAQLSRLFLKKLIECNLNLKMNFDDSVLFEELENIQQFYKEVIQCYNNVFVTDQDTFKNDILNQPLWGNKFISTNNRRKNKVLFLRNWIRSGINKISDLKFVNGELDEINIYNKIKIKINIYAEIFILKNAILPYKQIIKDYNNKEKTVQTPTAGLSSKQMYEKLINIKVKSINHMSNYLQLYLDRNDATETSVFYSKISCEKENKLKEFNYKLLYGILPCNSNLKRWNIINCDKCDVCDDTQTIEHLIFDCIYVKPIWQLVKDVFTIPVSFGNIVCPTKNMCSKNRIIITLISFLIYKEWLKASLDKRNREKKCDLDYFTHELQKRATIYNMCNMNDNVNSIDQLLNVLM